MLTLPQVLSYSYEANIEPLLAALKRRLGLSEVELKKIVLTLPPVLGLSYDTNLEPTLAFLQEELQLSKEILREKIVSMPPLLSYSLAKRYRPRLEQCREANEPVELVWKRVNLTDEKFEHLLAQRRQGREKEQAR